VGEVFIRASYRADALGAALFVARGEGFAELISGSRAEVKFMKFMVS
jgi:hypothetical protein